MCVPHDAAGGNGLGDYKENELIKKAIDGSTAAFDELCGRCLKKTRRIVERIVRNKEDADDALQDAMLNAFVHLPQFDRRAIFSTWFTRISINAALMHMRKKRLADRFSDKRKTIESDYEPQLEAVDPHPTPDHLFAIEQSKSELAKVVRRMRPALQQVVEIHYFKEFSLNETADALGISLCAAKARLFHARTQLRRQIKQKNINPRRGCFTE